MAKLLTLTKKEIKERTQYYVDRLGDRSGRRAIGARVLGVSLQYVEAWCDPSDPNVIPADKLMQLVIEAHFHELYIIDYGKIIDIYDDCEVLIGSANNAEKASFLADTHCGRLVMRPREVRWETPKIKMSEEQLLRSRLRKVVASGKVDIKQICRELNCDEYVLIDMQSEMTLFKFSRMPERTHVEVLESYVWAKERAA
ncbi:MAG: hypothetical protein O9256_00295 [Rhizobiaceae bacterium]|nr:hypothetical protein [Rhizobiaceae bacterium]MCZ8351217.1 hypothetical protein [Rhizobium sp.]